MGYYPKVYTRIKPRIKVLRGYTGNVPLSMQTSFPCKLPIDNNPANLMTMIQSGQLISTDPVTGAWVLGCPDGRLPYFALQDQLDSDVQATADKRNPGGILTAISCLGDFVVETGWFDSTVVYNPDDRILAAGANPGYITKTGGSGAGARLLGFVAPPGMNIIQDYSYVPGAAATPPLIPQGAGTVWKSENSEAGLTPTTTPLAGSSTITNPNPPPAVWNSGTQPPAGTIGAQTAVVRFIVRWG